MQNRIKLFLFVLFTPLLCLGAFSSANTFNIVGGGLNLSSLDFSSTTSISNITVSPSGCSLGLYVMSSNDLQGQNGGCRFQGNNGNYTFECFGVYGGQGFINAGNYRVQDMGSSCTSFSYSTSVVSDESSDCSSLEQELSTLSGNYKTCIDILNIRNGEVSTLSGQLASCNSDLASCTNSCDTLVSQCQENLSGCNADLSSMTNYKDSLESQLQQCLAEIPEPCTGTGCDEVSTGLNAVFSFFWERDDNMFSLPISNNIFLPRGITAYIDSGVVALAEEEKQKIKIDQGFEVLSGTYYHFFIGIVMLGIFCLFAYYVKKFISKSFIPKEK